MKIAVSTVDFLGAVIGEGTIKLEPHIIKKIVNFNEEELKTRKGSRIAQSKMKQLAASCSLLPQLEEILKSPNSPKTLNFQQQRKQSKPCEVYKQSYNAKPKSALACQPKTTTGLTKEKTSEFKTKKPEESLLN
ncbi:hypothetical protein Tco_0876524 [Tanacetum coccineum]|uniref:Uncharacterized protein n=1 Tax=Tanacetum coccineum TaxID=301880 RepID=A0ABQ5BVP2_9ASTR